MFYSRMDSYFFLVYDENQATVETVCVVTMLEKQ